MNASLAGEAQRWLRVRLVPILLCVACTAAAGSNGDERILAAREAARVNDKAKLAQLHTQQTQLFEKSSARMHEAMIAAAEILTPEQRKAMAERMGRRGMGPRS